MCVGTQGMWKVIVGRRCSQWHEPLSFHQTKRIGRYLSSTPSPETSSPIPRQDEDATPLSHLPPSLKSLKNTEIIQIHGKYLTDLALLKLTNEKHPFLLDFDEDEFMRGVNDAFENINNVLVDKKFQLFTQG
jgi:hypothetical protein